MSRRHCEPREAGRSNLKIRDCFVGLRPPRNDKVLSEDELLLITSMAKIIIDRNKCKGCLMCISVCPKGLIKADKKLNRQGIKPVKFDGEAGGCSGCTMCAIICPDCCIEVYK